MITVGDTFHNFVDGLIIAGAFLVDFRLGAVTSLAIIAHEIPQEIGDFLILLHSGYTRTQALLLNVLTGVATMAGALLGYYALSMLSSLAAIAGYPSITVPAGFVKELPVGISFFGTAWSEPTLIEIAYSYEQASKHRKSPKFLTSD